MYKEINDNEVIYMIKEDGDYYSLLIEKYRPLIINICKKYEKLGKDAGYELDDLIQLSNIALIDAINGYKENQDNLFYTYLLNCIKNKLKTELRNQHTNKKKVLNESISYDEIVKGTSLPLIEFIKDESVIEPLKLLEIEEEQNKYINFINSLPFEVALVVEMKNTGFSLDEISTFLKMDYDTINKCLVSARKRRYV